MKLLLITLLFVFPINDCFNWTASAEEYLNYTIYKLPTILSQEPPTLDDYIETINSVCLEHYYCCSPSNTNYLFNEVLEKNDEVRPGEKFESHYLVQFRNDSDTLNYLVDFKRKLFSTNGKYYSLKSIKKFKAYAGIHIE